MYLARELGPRATLMLCLAIWEILVQRLGLRGPQVLNVFTGNSPYRVKDACVLEVLRRQCPIIESVPQLGFYPI